MAGAPPARGTRRRLPPRSVRLRLTALYGFLFLLSGAALLTITYVLVANRLTAGPVLLHGSSGAGGGGPGVVALCAPAGGVPPSPGQLSQCTSYLKSLAAQQHANLLSQLVVTSGISLAVMAVAAVGLGWLVAGRVLRPLRTITAAARSVSVSSLHERLALGGPDDELKELGDTFDALLGRLEAAFAAQRQFVANASHELRTPLARQRTLVEVALADPAPTAGSLRDVCARVLAAGQEQERLIEALLTLARSQRGLDRREPLDLLAVVRDAVSSRQAEVAGRGLRITTSLGPAPTLGDGPLVERLTANLVENAVRHNVAGGCVRVSTRTCQGAAVLTVASGGPVIPAAEVSRLFQPFQRLAGGRSGPRDTPGLGLSIVAAIAEAHGAVVRARPLVAGGLEVEVCFPSVQPEQLRRAPVAGPVWSPGRASRWWPGWGRGCPRPASRRER